MRAQFLAGPLLGLLCLMPLPAASQQQSSAQQKNGQSRSSDAKADAKDAEPLPQVPRITAEEVERMIKSKANVVMVDTDDSIAYEDEHIKGAVNIAYDPTVDAREQDQSLSALPGDRLIVFYCNCAHEEDSAPFVLELWQLGYDHDRVKALKGGLTRWEQLGYPLAGSSVDASKSKGN